ncbi:hypothetical protein FRB98_002912 [Tulasnella sp. 332]|nr:hypothetical protein FRB98_002912 [Tulasnella sp. 332]
MDPLSKPWAEMAKKSTVSSYSTVAIMDDEIDYVWRRKWSRSKVLYIVTRYFGLLLLAFEVLADSRKWPEQFCDSYYIIVGVATTILLYSVEVGMQLRIYALYNCSRRVLFVNAILFAFEVIAISTLVGLDIHLSNDSAASPILLSRPFTGCWNGHHPHFSHAAWFIALTYESYLFALVSYQAYKKYAHYGTFMGIFKLMFRDAIAWFFFIAALIGWNAFSWLGGVTGYVFLGLPFLHAGACIGGSRLLLNLSKACYSSSSFVSMPVSTSTINFRPSGSAPSDGCTLRKCPTKPSASIPTQPRPPPRRTMSQVSRASVTTSRVPLASSSTYTAPSQAYADTSSIIYSATSSPPQSSDNALQLDLGLDHQTSPASVQIPVLEHREEERGSPRHLHYTYADAWAEVQCRTWGSKGWDVELGRGKSSGRKNVSSWDPRIASRSTSRSNSMQLVGA